MRIKILHLLPEKPIIEVLKNFGIGENKNTMVGLTVLDKKDIIVTNTSSIILKSNVQSLVIFNHSQIVHNILTGLFPNKIIATVEFTCIPDILLDMTSYESVSNTYKVLSNLGYTIDSDKKLISMARSKLTPSKKLIRSRKKLGKPAFKGSKVTQYYLDTIHCYDTNLIISLKEI